MTEVSVAILHPGTGPDAGPLVRAVAEARAGLAERHRAGFLEAGARRAWIVTGQEVDTPFGARLRAIAGDVARGAVRSCESFRFANQSSKKDDEEVSAIVGVGGISVFSA